MEDDVERDTIRRALAAERERIGRDLHDSVIQDLYGTGLLLEAALDLIDQPEVAERVRIAVDTVGDSIRQLRSIVFTMSEPDVAAPVAELISRVVAGRIGQLGFTPEVVVLPAQARLPGAVSAELLQFVSEALANVARHADATAAQVRLDVDRDGWSLAVHDDGRGFGLEGVRAGLGLATLRARAQLLAARFEVESTPGVGTTMRISCVRSEGT